MFTTHHEAEVTFLCTPIWTSMSSTLTHTHATFTHMHVWKWVKSKNLTVEVSEARLRGKRWWDTQCRGLWGARALPSRALSVSIWACVFVISSNWMIITILNENYKLALLICAHTCCRDTAVNSRNEITVLNKTHHRQKVMGGKCYFHPHFVAQLLACVPSLLSPFDLLC